MCSINNRTPIYRIVTLEFFFRKRWRHQLCNTVSINILPGKSCLIDEIAQFGGIVSALVDGLLTRSLLLRWKSVATVQAVDLIEVAVFVFWYQDGAGIMI